MSEERQLNAYRTGVRAGAGDSPLPTTSTPTIGSFSLDVCDSKAKQMVCGMSTKTLDPEASAEKRQKNIENGAAKLLKNFPPKKK
jgi:hypothetical protein